MRAALLALLTACAATMPPLDAELHGPASAAVEPFHIVGNVYYVGARNIAAYLLTTDAGHILIDTGTREMIPLVRDNITRLGFRIADIKLLLSTHAHFDHVQGHHALQAASGAEVAALVDDVAALSSGTDLSPLAGEGWDPIHVDRALHDGDTLTIGTTIVKAIWAPGHTQGCTVWTTTTRDADRTYDIAFYGCMGPNLGVRLAGNRRFPNLVPQTEATFRRLAQLSPDIFLVTHPEPDLAAMHHPTADRTAWQRRIAEDAADFASRVRAEQLQR